MPTELQKRLNAERSRRWRLKNPSKNREKQAAWRKQNPKAHQEIQRRGKLRLHFDITAEDYDELATLQNNRCAICRCDESQNRGGKNGSRRWCVDHDHLTGQLRGLLCHSCNKALGFLGDNPDRVYAAAVYLRDHAMAEAA
jgi:hypothetical protein